MASMLEEVIAFLSKYEPTINSIVGLITLGAAIWGAIHLTLLTRYKKSPEQETASDSAKEDNRTARRQGSWTALLNLGLGRRSRFEELVSVRSVNIALFMVLGISFVWLVISLFSRTTVLLTVLNLVAFVSALLAFSMQLSGRTGAARWIILVVVGLWWLAILMAIGPMAGVEYFLTALLALPILIFSRTQLGQMYLAISLMGLLFIGGIVLSRVISPLLALSEEVLFRGYFLNVAFLSVAVYSAVRYYKHFAATNYHLLEDQKRRNDNLVLNMLPEHIASRVSEHEETVAEWHPEVTVLYASIEGIDLLYKKMSAIQLVRLLSDVFLQFDRLVVWHELDKVKTLGTNYLVASGIDQSRVPDHAAVAACALAMREAVAEISERSGYDLALRAGIANGKAVSGVIGEARPCFDIWGETVEQANRLRTRADNGSLLVAESTYWRLQGDYDFSVCKDGDSTYELRAAVSG